jgi:cytochrome c5
LHFAFEDFMSDAHNSHDQDDSHEGPIKTPKQLIITVVLSFVVPIAAILLLVSYVTSDHQPVAGSDGLSAEAVARRIQPVATVAVKDPSDIAAMKSGEQVFAAQCTACHTAGVGGAPKVGDADAWGVRIKTGYAALLTSALKGKGAMGAQGGGDFSDLEIGRAVVFMANKVGAKFDEPKAAAAEAAAPAPATPAPTAAAPAAPVMVATAAAATAPAKADTAAAPPLYAQICQACHLAGVAGAPKIGDKTAWAPRLEQGIDALTSNVIKGKGAMPPKGGSAATDAEIKTVVTYMVNSAK